MQLSYREKKVLATFHKSLVPLIVSLLIIYVNIGFLFFTHWPLCLRLKCTHPLSIISSRNHDQIKFLVLQN